MSDPLASLSSLSYPPKTPSAGADRFLLLLSGAETDALAGFLADATVAGGFDTGSTDSFVLVSFFLMTPFNNDLTFLLDGAAGAGAGFADATEGTTGASAGAVRSSIGGSINPPCLLCSRLPTESVNKQLHP